jgi:acetyl-CoA synthetase
MSYPYQIRSEAAYCAAYKKSIEDAEGYWAAVAESFVWHKPWDKVLEWEFETPQVAWYKGAQLNITENCLDRHLSTLGDRPAIIWEPNDIDEAHRVLTYKQLHHQVQLFAQVLKQNGVQKGDRVCIYMGMVPELAIAILACARIGAIHSVIFGGFSAQSIADRLIDAPSTHSDYLRWCLPWK